MNVNKKIEELLKSFGLPYDYGKFMGSAGKYIVYNCTGATPEEFADDEPQSEKTNIQIHLYCKKNIDYTKDKKELKKAIVKAGFDYPRTELEELEEDTDLWHICLETSITYGINEPAE